MLNADYAGVSTAGDYQYIVSSLGYAGYDSLITEKNWQEFMAYEYAVLMDVAEYLWEGQNEWNESNPGGYKDTVMGPYPAEYYAANKGKDYDDTTVETTELEGVSENTSVGIKGTGPAYMPYLPVIQEYNSAALTKEDWNKLVIAGQGSARFGIQNEAELGNEEFAKDSIIYGGNRDVMPPTLMYEYKNNPNEPEGPGSLVPYIAVLKEELQYFYFTVGNREEFEGTVDEHSGGVVINEGNIDKVDLMEISQLLNVGNAYLTKSTVWSQWWENNQDSDPRYNKEAWPIADETFEQNLYFTNMYASVVYKTALQIMIDRYLPKASLLTSWYYLKDTDLASAETQGKENVVNLSGTVSNFDLDKLMKDIKAIYNYYCWEEPGESIESETVESVTYDPADGKVLRDDDGKAIKSSVTHEVASTNNDTFIHFGQAGIESNRFEVFKTYEPKGIHAAIPKPEAPASITGDPEEITVPVITELLSEDAQFMDRFGFKVTFDYTYQYSYEQRVLSGYSGGGGGDSGGSTVSVTVYGDCVDYVTGSSTFGIGYHGNWNSCGCGSKNALYGGYRILSSRGDTNPRSATYTLEVPGSSSGGGGDDGGSATGQPIYTWVPVTETGTATGNIVIPYEATNNIAPRGESWTMDAISQFVHDQIVLRAEQQIMDEIAALRQSSDFEIEFQEEEFVNHGYWYPESTYMDGEDLKASVITYFDERYRHNLGFYNFKAVSGDDAPTEEELLNSFKEKINEIFANLDSYDGQAVTDPFSGKDMTAGRTKEELKQLIKEYLEALYVGTGRMPKPEPYLPEESDTIRNVNFDGVLSIDRVYDEIGGIAENVPTDQYDVTNLILKGGALITTAVEPEAYNKTFSFENNFTKVSEQPEPYNAIYDIDDYILALALAIPQKRIATMIVTDVEAWAKSATYSIMIVNNTFDYTNYRYVVPHSYFNFGVRVFNIDEKPSYRTEYYKEYFSKIDAEKAGIKEADVLTMLLKWEEFAESGNDTAYAYMRDLYKLILYIREKYEGDQILSTAYSYLYVPDTIWEFREGISQEAFWTERLAAEMPGRPDALTEEELKKVLVKKEEIAWQVLDYSEYEECQYVSGGETKAKVYALFPHGSSYVRTWFQEEALGGRFNDGGFVVGHESADWLARSDVMMQLLNGNDPYGIVEYEIKTRAARKILGGNSGLSDRVSRAESVLNGSTSDNVYIATETEVMAEIKELSVKSPIVSIAAGTVYKANYDCYSGFAVGVTHHNENAGSSAETSYVHMRRWPTVQTNDVVGPGTIVGYEGTTGNSSGYHLHQNLWVGGTKASPAAYMGPIFTPFYNKEKILETVGKIENEWNASRIVVLGTEYMDLYRTVLKYPLDSDPELQNYLFNGGTITAGGTTFLMQCSFMEINGNEYINYQTGNKNGIPMYYNGNNSVVVKVGASPSIYYACNVSEELVSEEIDDRGNVTQTKYLRVNSKEEIQFDESTLAGGVKIRVAIGTDAVTDIIWGNNVNLYPLLEDMADLVDITVLNTERTLNPKDALYASEYSKDANDPEGGEDSDVTAREEFFSPDNDERLKIPDWILSYMSDMDSLFAVPFYEGPTSIGMQGQIGTSAREIGYAGTASGDVLALKKALKMKGYANGDELPISGDDAGDFDEKLQAVLMKAGEDVGNNMVIGGENYFQSGVLGASSDAGNYMDDFGHQGVCGWNAYVTYGSVSASQDVGREAARMAATVTGLRPAFVMGVAHCESSFVPTVDSFLFCSERQKFNFYTDEKDDGFVTLKGVDKVIRRAVGLMQIAPPGAISMAASKLGCEVNDDNIEQILRYLRNARTNAILGAEILCNMINMIQCNENGWYDLLKSVVNSNSVFDRIEAVTGVDKYEIAMIGAATLMYNMGPGNGNTEKVINAMATVEFVEANLENPNLMPSVGADYSEQVSKGYAIRATDDYSGTGYWIGVMDYVARQAYHLKNQEVN